MTDLVGKRFGRLVVIEVSHTAMKNRKVMWSCRCDCGRITRAERYHLVNGLTRSCGCLRRERHNTWSKNVFNNRRA